MRQPNFPGLQAVLLWTVSAVFAAILVVWSSHAVPAVGHAIGLRSIPASHGSDVSSDGDGSPPPRTPIEAWVAERHAFPDPPTPVTIPEVCLDDLRSERPNGTAISLCVDTLAAAAAARGPRDSMCWPTKPQPAARRARLSDAEVLSITLANCSGLPETSIFHTVVLGGAPSSVFGPFLWAFLATQCCSAELWVWTTAPLTRDRVVADYGLPPQHAHRIRVLPFDAAAHWRAANGEEVFREASGGGSGEALLVGDYMGRVNHANQADVVRLLLLERYGGMYVDMDVLPLQDLRPLMALRPAVTYRWSCFTIINTAVSHWGACGSDVSHEITAAVLKGMTPGRPPENAYYNAITYATIKRLGTLPEWAGRVGVVPSMLCDPLWTRLDGCEPEGVHKYNPEVRNFEGFYTPR